jgi:uncharacterized protein YbjT (DUF2867 family)
MLYGHIAILCLNLFKHNIKNQENILILLHQLQETLMTSPILIIGKNGKTGLRVNQRLLDLGYTTRAVSRSTNPAFDWELPETWEEAMRGTTTVYITYQPDLAVPQAEAAIKRFIKIAASVGIKHLVLLSGRGEEGAQRAENIIINSGITWNIVRASWFNQNFSESFMLDGILSGELILPESNTIEPFVDVDDIADVVVAALTQTKLHNRLFEVTGPEAITFADCVKIISAALNRPIKLTSVPIDSYINAIAQQGMPADVQWLIRELFTVVFDGRNCHIKHGIEQALKRAPTSFKTYVEKTIESGVWNISHQEKSA